MNRRVNVIGTCFSLLVFLAASNGIASGAQLIAEQTATQASSETESYFAKAQASRNAKDYKAALEHINKVIELEPNNPKWHCEAAAVSIDAGDVDGANQHVNQAVKLDADKSVVPDFIKNITEQARTSAEAKQWAQALNGFNVALGFDPKNVGLLIDRSAVRHRMKDFNGAVVDMNDAIKLSPKVADLYALRALYKVQIGDTASADADCDKAEEMQADPRLIEDARIAIEKAMAPKKKK
jgi:Flp pilus assembly protein TadD